MDFIVLKQEFIGLNASIGLEIEIYVPSAIDMYSIHHVTFPTFLLLFRNESKETNLNEILTIRFSVSVYINPDI